MKMVWFEFESQEELFCYKYEILSQRNEIIWKQKYPELNI